MEDNALELKVLKVTVEKHGSDDAAKCGRDCGNHCGGCGGCGNSGNCSH